MKTRQLLLAVTLVASSTLALSDPYLAELSAPNEAGGRTVLTFQPCQLEIASRVQEHYIKDGEQLYYAYSLAYEGTPLEVKSHGCWFVPKFDPADAGPAATPVVNIFTESGLIFPHSFGEFSSLPNLM